MATGVCAAPDCYTFSGRRYVVGDVYSFRQLPPEAQRDAARQDDDIQVHYGLTAEAAHYRLVVVPHDELVTMLQRRFGEQKYETMMRRPDVAAFARIIDREGLQNPPVLDEGWRRAWALAYLGWDMPYFLIDEPIEMPPYADMPTLEGRRKRR